MNDIVSTYKQRKPAGHFFDPDTMRFFRSRVGACIEYNSDGPVYFLTSERFIDSSGRAEARMFTARVMDLDGDIHDIGGFNVHSRGEAERLARQAASLKLTAREIGNGGLAIKCADEAKKLWESSGGSITPEVEQQRRNADHWAKEAGWKLVWSSITPGIVRPDGREYMFAQIAPLMA